MSGDLVTLRMLVITASGPEQDLWRQGAALSSVPVEVATHDASAASGVLGRGGIDICIIDASLPDGVKANTIKAARTAQPPSLVFVAGPRGGARVEGVDGTLVKPDNADDARKLAETCIRLKIPTRVLVVDDSSTMRSIVRKILSASRFALDVHEAAEGIAALNQLRGGNFGLVFLDYNMPGFNGFETLSEIKRENPNTGVVMMTSTVSNAVAERAHASGALAFLKKPFYPADIDAVLERFFGLHKPIG